MVKPSLGGRVASTQVCGSGRAPAQERLRRSFPARFGARQRGGCMSPKCMRPGAQALGCRCRQAVGSSYTFIYSANIGAYSGSGPRNRDTQDESGALTEDGRQQAHGPASTPSSGRGGRAEQGGWAAVCAHQAEERARWCLRVAHRRWPSSVGPWAEQSRAPAESCGHAIPAQDPGDHALPHLTALWRPWCIILHLHPFTLTSPIEDSVLS